MLFTGAIGPVHDEIVTSRLRTSRLGNEKRVMPRHSGRRGFKDDSGSEVVGVSAPLVFSLPSDPRAAASARRRVREHLDLVAPSVVDDALMAVSELVTNAVRYGEGDLEVRVRRASGVLRIEVFDAGQCLPQPSEVTEESLGGRGLHVVGELATRWGTTLDGTGPGKVVWCEFHLPADVEIAHAVEAQNTGPSRPDRPRQRSSSQQPRTPHRSRPWTR